jgi:hypothetical protein
MARYFFDIHGGESVEVDVDDLGMECPDMAAAEREALQTLAAAIPGHLATGKDFEIAIEVRSAAKPLARFVMRFKAHRF